MANSMFGDGWRGGSARAAVRGYVTRQGKRVKAHTRQVVKRQVKRTKKAAGTALLGKTAYAIITNRGDTWQTTGIKLVAAALGISPTKGKRKGGRRK